MSLSLLEISVTIDSGKTRPLILNIKMLSYKCMDLQYENKKVSRPSEVYNAKKDSLYMYWDRVQTPLI